MPPNHESKVPKSEILKFIEGKQVIGASLEQIQAFKPGITEQDLRKLEDKNFIYRLGINTFKWVHKDHIIPWIATDVNQSRREEKEHVQYFAKIWRRPDGSVNTKIIFKFLSAIVAHVMINPGISEKRLVEHFQQLAPGTQVREFIELLIAADCLTYHPSLDIGPSSSSVLANVSERWLETTSDCNLILPLLKQRLDN